jgi:hypothetical protein
MMSEGEGPGEVVPGADEVGSRSSGAVEAFFAELRAAFSRRSPRGSHAWNFSEGFRRLDDAVSSAREALSIWDRRADSSLPVSSLRAAPAVSAAHCDDVSREDDGRRVHRRTLWPRLFRVLARLFESDLDRYFANRMELAMNEVRHVAEILDRQASVLSLEAEGLEAAREAIRFLEARVACLELRAETDREVLSRARCFHRSPDLNGWAGTILELLDSASGGPNACRGPVVHAECGGGELVARLALDGWTVVGVDPAPGAAWDAAEKGVAVRIQEALGYLSSVEPSSLGGVVLSGFVDRVGPARALEAIRLGFASVAAGCPVVVIGTHQGWWGECMRPEGRDLSPGAPMLPATWKVLMESEGAERSRVAGEEADGPRAGVAGTFAVIGYRPA